LSIRAALTFSLGGGTILEMCTRFGVSVSASYLLSTRSFPLLQCSQGDFEGDPGFLRCSAGPLSSGASPATDLRGEPGSTAGGLYSSRSRLGLVLPFPTATLLSSSMVLVPLPFSSGGGGDVGAGSGEGRWWRLVVLRPSVCGVELLFAPWGLVFLVGLRFVGGGASLFGLRLLWFVFLLDLVQLRSVSQRRWRNWVVRRESSTADVLIPRISCGLPSGVTFLVWLRGGDGGVACCSATVRMEQRNNREERRKKKRDLFVISDFCRDPSVKRVSTVLDLCFILM